MKMCVLENEVLEICNCSIQRNYSDIIDDQVSEDDISPLHETGPKDLGCKPNVQDEEQTFETWKISTISGQASRKLKNALAKIFDSGKTLGSRLGKLSEIEESFYISYNGIYILNEQDSVIFLGKHDEVVLRVSKKRKLSLQDLAAVKICEAQSKDTINSLSRTRNITHIAAKVIMKYL